MTRNPPTRIALRPIHPTLNLGPYSDGSQNSGRSGIVLSSISHRHLQNLGTTVYGTVVSAI